jgi:hypothetical protein
VSNTATVNWSNALTIVETAGSAAHTGTFGGQALPGDGNPVNVVLCADPTCSTQSPAGQVPPVGGSWQLPAPVALNGKPYAMATQVDPSNNPQTVFTGPFPT